MLGNRSNESANSADKPACPSDQTEAEKTDQQYQKEAEFDPNSPTFRHEDFYERYLLKFITGSVRQVRLV